MKFLNIFILSCLIGSAFGGSSSYCGSIQSQFAALLQACDTFINNCVTRTTDIVNAYPLMGNASIAELYCKINVTTYILATGTSQISGIGIDYILGILEGTTVPPFTQPLDCIETELLSYHNFLLNINATVVPNLTSLIQVTTVSSSISCVTTMIIANATLTSILQNYTTISTRVAADGSGFSNIGLSALYADFQDELVACENQAAVNALMEVYNESSTVASTFLANTDAPVPTPLGCIHCEPLLTQVITLVNNWNSLMFSLEAYALSSAQDQPTLTSMIITDFLCQLETMTIFFANATSGYSGVDSQIIYDILTGVTAPPYPIPLDCVTFELNSVRSKILQWKSTIGTTIGALAVNSTSNTQTCANAYNSLKNKVAAFIDYENGRIVVISNHAQAFRDTNLIDLFLDSFAASVACGPAIVGDFVGGVLNLSGAPVTAYLAGSTMTMPYPFSCVRVIIGILDNAYNTALVNIITDMYTSLPYPNVPIFRG